MMTSGTVVKRLEEDTSDVSVIVRQKPECHAVINERSGGSWDAVEADGFGRESANASPDSQFGSRERSGVSFIDGFVLGDQSRCRRDGALSLWVASAHCAHTGTVGRAERRGGLCVKHPGLARGADPRCSCAANGLEGEGDCR